MRRDGNLDCAKGIACILMILAHAHGYGKTSDNWLTLFIYQLGLFAPVVFLSCVGVSLNYQLKKRHIIPIVAGYLLLLIISFANMGLGFKNYFILSDWNLYGLIALSSILNIILTDYINLPFAFLPIILFFTFSKLNLEVSLFYGGLFSVIPWTSFTLIGFYLHKHKHLIKTLSVFLFIMLLLIFLIAKSYPGDFEYNTPFYIISGLLIYNFVQVVSRVFSEIKYLSNLLLYLGKNSLLFYVIHRLFIICLPFKLPAPFLWILLLIIPVSIMFIIVKLNEHFIARRSDSFIFWAILILLITLPYIVPMGINFQRAVMFAVLILHALNYRNFVNLRILKKFNLNER